MTDRQDDEAAPEASSATYSGLSDDDFRAELRRHLHDASWTVQHWLELERRDDEILACDPDLDSAMRAQRERTFRGINDALASVAEQWKRRFEAIAAQVPRFATSFTFPSLPQFELDLPKFDFGPLTESTFASVPSESILDDSASIAALAKLQEDRLQREAEAYIATVGQYQLLRDIEQANRTRHDELLGGYEKLTDAVWSSRQPRWTMLLMIVLTATAAAASVAALL